MRPAAAAAPALNIASFAMFRPIRLASALVCVLESQPGRDMAQRPGWSARSSASADSADFEAVQILADNEQRPDTRK